MKRPPTLRPPFRVAVSPALRALFAPMFLNQPGAGTLPTSAPDAPDLMAASDSGVSATDDLTNVTTPVFRVGLPPEALATNVVRVYRAGSVEIGSKTLDSTDISNDYADILTSALASGAHTITAKVENAGGLSPASTGLAITVDAVAPDAPTGLVVTPADQGLAPLQTDNTQPTFRISLPANAVAGDVGTLQIDGADDATAALDGTDISNGYADIQSANVLADDSFYEIAAYLTDVAGNEGAPIAAVLVEVGTAGVSAITLNGINQYYAMDAGPGGIAAGQAFTRNLHWDPTGTVDGQVYTLFCISSWVPSTHEVIDFIIERLANNKIEARAYDNAGVLIGSVVSTSTVTNASGWTFIGVSMSGTSLRLRLDGAEESNQTAGTLADCQLGNKWWLGRGADPAAPNYTKGCLAEASAYEAALDYSDDNIAEQFFDSTAGLPRDIGADGSGPNPNVVEYLNKVYTAFHENLANADDYGVFGFIQPCVGPGAYSAAFLPSVGPSIVSGSFAHGTDASNSSASRNLIADYDPGAGSNRKVFAAVCFKPSGTFNFFSQSILDGLAWGSVPFRRYGTVFANDIGHIEFGFIDEASFPAAGTNPISVNTAGNIAVSVTVFTVQDAMQGLWPEVGLTAAGTNTTANLSITTGFDNSLVLSFLLLDRSITDHAATGTDHAIIDDYDSGAGSLERIVVGELVAATAGAQTIGYSFSNAGRVGFSLAIPPVGAYVPFDMDYNPKSTGVSVSQTDHQIAMPDVVNAGDLIHVRLGVFFNELTPASTITTPAGFTLLRKHDSTSGATDSFSCATYVKESTDGSEAGTTVNFITGANATAAALVDRIKSGTWSGNIADIESASSPGVGGGSTPVSPSLSPTFSSEVWLYIPGSVIVDDDDVNGTLPYCMSSNDARGMPQRVSGAGANAGVAVSGGYRVIRGAYTSQGINNTNNPRVCSGTAIRKAA